MVSSNPTVAILAGGLARRLGPLSATVPKSMIEVGGVPFLAHQLHVLADQDFHDVVVCAGHLSKAIEDFAGNGSAFGCRVRYSFDGEQLLGTGGALRKALPLLGDQFLTLYGDSYLRAEFQPILERFGVSGKSALMTVFRNEGQWNSSNVELVDGEIRSYDKIAPTAAMRHIDYGLGCIRAEALSSFALTGAAFDLWAFYVAMLRQRQLAAFEVGERFYEIGSTEGLAETDALVRSFGARTVK